MTAGTAARETAKEAGVSAGNSSQKVKVGTVQDLKPKRSKFPDTAEGREAARAAKREAKQNAKRNKKADARQRAGKRKLRRLKKFHKLFGDENIVRITGSWIFDLAYAVLVACLLFSLPAYLNTREAPLPDPDNSSTSAPTFLGPCNWQSQRWAGPLAGYLPACTTYDFGRGFPSLHEAQTVCSIINANLSAGWVRDGR